MSREIKFRAWHKNKMIVPDYITEDGMAAEYESRDDPTLLNDAIIMQFTGLKDKNDKEIYEGDIIAAKLHNSYVERVYWDGPPDIIGVVFWDLNAFRLKTYGENEVRYSDFSDYQDAYTWEPFVRMNKSETEVIGNIYQTPELVPAGADFEQNMKERK